MEHHPVLLFPEMLAAQEQEGGRRVGGNRWRSCEQVKRADVGVRRDVNTDRALERGDHGIVEGHVTRGLERGAAHGAAGLVRRDDGLAQEEIACVHTRLDEEPSEEAHTRRGAAAPEERGIG
jgi:hypothetical protein